MTTLKERFPQLTKQYDAEIQRFLPIASDGPIINFMYHGVLDTNTEITDDWLSVWQILSAAGTAAVLFAGHKAELPLALCNAFVANLKVEEQNRLYDELLSATKLTGEPESFLLNLQDFSILLNYSTVLREVLGERIGILERNIFYGCLPIIIKKHFIDDYKKLYNIDNSVRGLLPQFED